MKFADLCEEFIIQAQSGEPYDVENLPEETIPFYMIFLISLVVGFVIALIVTGVMRSRMKTVHMKPDAADYMKDGSLHINRSRDIFLYHQVTRTAKRRKRVPVAVEAVPIQVLRVRRMGVPGGSF